VLFTLNENQRVLLAGVILASPRFYTASPRLICIVSSRWQAWVRPSLLSPFTFSRAS
jgi:hypothetical protein